jgi:AmmeMemoRadiSam system protein B/AmmeMemoRadiSam system protein A
MIVKGIWTAFWVASCVISMGQGLWAAQKEEQTTRPPAVAGLFYPGDADALEKTVRALMDRAEGAQVGTKIRALIAPHAGYIYSGGVAAAVYRQIDPQTKTVILLGPSHRLALQGISIPSVAAYQTPLGPVPLSDLADKLRQHPGIASVAEAHEKEHALEVQLPFLQVVLKDFQIVPILIHDADPAVLASILEPYVDDGTLVIASSDLSHYHSYDTAVSLDRICTDAVVRGRFSNMTRCEACGKEAMATLMCLAEKKGWRGILVDYKNSGDTAGDRDRVVGYASIAFVDKKETANEMRQDLSDEEKKALLRLARSAMEARLLPNAKIERPQTSCPVFLEKRGCFVTLHKHGQLRGCIGTIEPVSALVSSVEENARNAAFRDPRFPSLTEEELPDIDIEISILTVPEKILFRDGEDLKRQLDPVTHGVILSRGASRSTFLPQVWKQLPEKEQFLEHLCRKGGMSPEAWKDPKTEVSVYRAEVFGEQDFR